MVCRSTVDRMFNAIYFAAQYGLSSADIIGVLFSLTQEKCPHPRVRKQLDLVHYY